LDQKFTTLTSGKAIRERNLALYAEQRALIEKNPISQKILAAKWPETPPSETLKTPLAKDGVKAFATDMPTLLVAKENLLTVVEFVKNETGFKYDFLLDLTAVDFLGTPRQKDLDENTGRRFQVIYVFRSLQTSARSATLRITVPVAENEEVPTLTSLWSGADWPEREVFDLMGIRFAGHPNLRRIVLPENYRGHPLRKDFPVKGIGEDYLIEDLLHKRRNVD